MNTTAIIEALNKKQNGSFFKVRLVSPVSLNAAAKRSGVVAYKITEMTVRKGIDYKAQKSVQAKVDAGKILVHDLPWGTWMKGQEGLIIDHKGSQYVRLYSSPNKSTVKYFLNGVEVTRDELKDSGHVLSSYFNKPEEKPDAMTVKAENIQKIW